MGVVRFYMGSDWNNITWKVGGNRETGYFGVGVALDTEYEGCVRLVNVTIPQGTTITSATLSLRISLSGYDPVKCRVTGIDVDNVPDFTDDPFVKNQTTAVETLQISPGSPESFQNIDVTDEAQEIINRDGWQSGNAIGFQFWNNGSDNTHYLICNSLDHYLEINYNAPSESKSASKSASKSLSPSSSYSPSASLSPSSSGSPSPAPVFKRGVLKIAKSGVNALTNSDVDKYKFHSDYGTLKYYSKQTKSLTLTAGDFAVSGTIDHDLGYYPYIEVYVSSAVGGYQYCPFSGAGASVFYGATYKITTTQIVFYVESTGFEEDQTFDFIVFIYKNDLKLS